MCVGVCVVLMKCTLRTTTAAVAAAAAVLMEYDHFAHFDKPVCVLI